MSVIIPQPPPLRARPPPDLCRHANPDGFQFCLDRQHQRNRNSSIKMNVFWNLQYWCCYSFCSISTSSMFCCKQHFSVLLTPPPIDKTGSSVPNPWMEMKQIFPLFFPPLFFSSPHACSKAALSPPSSLVVPHLRPSLSAPPPLFPPSFTRPDRQ